MSRFQFLLGLTSLLLLMLSFTLSGAEVNYSLELGTKREVFDYPPILTLDGQVYFALNTLTRLEKFETYREKSYLVGPVKIQDENNVESQEEVISPQSTSDSLSEDGNYDDSDKNGDAIIDVGKVSIEVRKRSQIEKPGLIEGEIKEFTLGARTWQIIRKRDGAFLSTGDGSIVTQLVVKGESIYYIPEGFLSNLGLMLAYNPATSEFTLLGIILSARFDAQRNSLMIRTLLPANGYIQRLKEGEIGLRLRGCFVPEVQKVDIPKEIAESVTIANLFDGEVMFTIKQKEQTGYKLYAEEEPYTYFRLEFENHFTLVSYDTVSSGEIALNIEFSKATPIKQSYITNPDRLVLDFPNAKYDEATKRIEVNIGGVREIRVAQFNDKPATVRVVVEMTRRLNYRILPQEGGRVYYVQFHRGELRGAPIMLDAGHGGSDTGAIGVSKVFEKAITLMVTKRVAQKLRAMGFNVYMTRSDDNFISLGQRADLANSLLPAIFVSIHANSIEDPTFSGIMTFHFKDSEPGRLLANLLQKRLIEFTTAMDRGVRTANFYVLRETVVPAVLVEIGFMTNAYEESKLKDPSYQDRVAEGLSRGIFDYLQMTGGL